MSKRTVLKVDTSCQKCKQKVMQAVSGLEGVDKIEIDTEKSTMTVTGNVDPIDVIVRTRKTGKHAEVVTIGPPPKPEEKKPENKASDPTGPVYVHVVPSCVTCQRVAYDDYPPLCSIL